MKFKHKNVKYKFTQQNQSTFRRLGYKIKRVQICASCSKLNPKGRNNKCCANYNARNRRKKTYIENMIIRDCNKEEQDKYIKTDSD